MVLHLQSLHFCNHLNNIPAGPSLGPEIVKLANAETILMFYDVLTNLMKVMGFPSKSVPCKTFFKPTFF